MTVVRDRDFKSLHFHIWSYASVSINNLYIRILNSLPQVQIRRFCMKVGRITRKYVISVNCRLLWVLDK